MFLIQTQIMKAKAKKESMEETLNMVQDVLKKTSASLINATESFEVLKNI